MLNGRQLSYLSVGRHCNKMGFFEVSPCLSRACLGTISIFIYKWLKSPFFSPGSPASRTRDTRTHLHSPTLVGEKQPKGAAAEVMLMSC